MDPTTLMQLIAHLRQQGQGQGLSQGQMPPMGQGQLPPMQGQMPPQGQAQGQLPPMTPPHGGMGQQGLPGQDRAPHHGHGGLNPWMMLSPLGGLLGGGGMGALAPMFGLAGLFGSKLFK